MTVYRSMIKLVFLLGLATNAFAAAQPDTKQTKIDGTQGYRDEMHRPPEPWKGPPRSGAKVYADSCATCHARTTQGAPLPDDDVEWRMRAGKGMDVLMAHVIDGYKELMPQRGGCPNCSDAELKAAVLYILGQSGITPGSMSANK
ncbi:MAG TPA: cytochrome c5 family protein [Gammaproteobacteria bacterium]|nr:cytochrome c5 family protein [Gammaproteobacteria bacterium]